MKTCQHRYRQITRGIWDCDECDSSITFKGKQLHDKRTALVQVLAQAWHKEAPNDPETLRAVIKTKNEKLKDARVQSHRDNIRLDSERQRFDEFISEVGEVMSTKTHTIKAVLTSFENRMQVVETAKTDYGCRLNDLEANIEALRKEVHAQSTGPSGNNKGLDMCIRTCRRLLKTEVDRHRDLKWGIDEMQNDLEDLDSL